MELSSSVGNLSIAEQHKIWQVLQRDEVLQNKQYGKINDLKNEIHDIRRKGILRDGDDLSRLCARCHSQLGVIFNKGEICPNCRFKMCKNCRVALFSGGWTCIYCFKQMQLKWLSGDWTHGKMRSRNLTRRASGSDLIRSVLVKSVLPGNAGKAVTEEIRRAITNGSVPPSDELERDSSQENSPVGGSTLHDTDVERVGFPSEADSFRLSRLIGSYAGNTASEEKGRVCVKRVSSRPYRDSDSDSSSSIATSPTLSAARKSENISTSSLSTQDKTIEGGMGVEQKSINGHKKHSPVSNFAQEKQPSNNMAGSSSNSNEIEQSSSKLSSSGLSPQVESKPRLLDLAKSRPSSPKNTSLSIDSCHSALTTQNISASIDSGKIPASFQADAGSGQELFALSPSSVSRNIPSSDGSDNEQPIDSYFVTDPAPKDDMSQTKKTESESVKPLGLVGKEDGDVLTFIEENQTHTEQQVNSDQFGESDKSKYFTISAQKESDKDMSSKTFTPIVPDITVKENKSTLSQKDAKNKKVGLSDANSINMLTGLSHSPQSDKSTFRVQHQISGLTVPDKQLPKKDTDIKNLDSKKSYKHSTKAQEGPNINEIAEEKLQLTEKKRFLFQTNLSAGVFRRKIFEQSPFTEDEDKAIKMIKQSPKQTGDLYNNEIHEEKVTSVQKSRFPSDINISNQLLTKDLYDRENKDVKEKSIITPKTSSALENKPKVEKVYQQRVEQPYSLSPSTSVSTKNVHDIGSKDTFLKKTMKDATEEKPVAAEKQRFQSSSLPSNDSQHRDSGQNSSKNIGNKITNKPVPSEDESFNTFDKYYRIKKNTKISLNKDSSNKISTANVEKSRVNRILEEKLQATEKLRLPLQNILSVDSSRRKIFEQSPFTEDEDKAIKMIKQSPKQTGDLYNNEIHEEKVTSVQQSRFPSDINISNQLLTKDLYDRENKDVKEKSIITPKTSSTLENKPKVEKVYQQRVEQPYSLSKDPSTSVSTKNVHDIGSKDTFLKKTMKDATEEKPVAAEKQRFQSSSLPSNDSQHRDSGQNSSKNIGNKITNKPVPSEDESFNPFDKYYRIKKDTKISLNKDSSNKISTANVEKSRVNKILEEKLQATEKLRLPLQNILSVDSSRRKIFEQSPFTEDEDKPIKIVKRSPKETDNNKEVPEEEVWFIQKPKFPSVISIPNLSSVKKANEQIGKNIKARIPEQSIDIADYIYFVDRSELKVQGQEKPKFVSSKYKFIDIMSRKLFDSSVKDFSNDKDSKWTTTNSSAEQVKDVKEKKVIKKLPPTIENKSTVSSSKDTSDKLSSKFLLHTEKKDKSLEQSRKNNFHKNAQQIEKVPVSRQSRFSFRGEFPLPLSSKDSPERQLIDVKDVKSKQVSESQETENHENRKISNKDQPIQHKPQTHFSKNDIKEFHSNSQKKPISFTTKPDDQFYQSKSIHLVDDSKSPTQDVNLECWIDRKEIKSSFKPSFIIRSQLNYFSHKDKIPPSLPSPSNNTNQFTHVKSEKKISSDPGKPNNDRSRLLTKVSDNKNVPIVPSKPKSTRSSLFSSSNYWIDHKETKLSLSHRDTINATTKSETSDNSLDIPYVAHVASSNSSPQLISKPLTDDKHTVSSYSKPTIATQISQQTSIGLIDRKETFFSVEHAKTTRSRHKNEKVDSERKTSKSSDDYESFPQRDTKDRPNTVDQNPSFSPSESEFDYKTKKVKKLSSTNDSKIRKLETEEKSASITTPVKETTYRSTSKINIDYESKTTADCSNDAASTLDDKTEKATINLSTDHVTCVTKTFKSNVDGLTDENNITTSENVVVFSEPDKKINSEKETSGANKESSIDSYVSTINSFLGKKKKGLHTDYGTSMLEDITANNNEKKFGLNDDLSPGKDVAKLDHVARRKDIITSPHEKISQEKQGEKHVGKVTSAKSKKTFGPDEKISADKHVANVASPKRIQTLFGPDENITADKHVEKVTSPKQETTFGLDEKISADKHVENLASPKRIQTLFGPDENLTADKHVEKVTSPKQETTFGPDEKISADKHVVKVTSPKTKETTFGADENISPVKHVANLASPKRIQTTFGSDENISAVKHVTKLTLPKTNETTFGPAENITADKHVVKVTSPKTKETTFGLDENISPAKHVANLASPKTKETIFGSDENISAVKHVAKLTLPKTNETTFGPDENITADKHVVKVTSPKTKETTFGLDENISPAKHVAHLASPKTKETIFGSDENISAVKHVAKLTLPKTNETTFGPDENITADKHVVKVTSPKTKETTFGLDENISPAKHVAHLASPKTKETIFGSDENISAVKHVTKLHLPKTKETFGLEKKLSADKHVAKVISSKTKETFGPDENISPVKHVANLASPKRIQTTFGSDENISTFKHVAKLTLPQTKETFGPDENMSADKDVAKVTSPRTKEAFGPDEKTSVIKQLAKLSFPKTNATTFGPDEKLSADKHVANLASPRKDTIFGSDTNIHLPKPVVTIDPLLKRKEITLGPKGIARDENNVIKMGNETPKKEMSQDKHIAKDELLDKKETTFGLDEDVTPEKHVSHVERKETTFELDEDIPLNKYIEKADLLLVKKETHFEPDENMPVDKYTAKQDPLGKKETDQSSSLLDTEKVTLAYNPLESTNNKLEPLRDSKTKVGNKTTDNGILPNKQVLGLDRKLGKTEIVSSNHPKASTQDQTKKEIGSKAKQKRSISPGSTLPTITRYVSSLHSERTPQSRKSPTLNMGKELDKTGSSSSDVHSTISSNIPQPNIDHKTDNSNTTLVFSKPEDEAVYWIDRKEYKFSPDCKMSLNKKKLVRSHSDEDKLPSEFGLQHNPLSATSVSFANKVPQSKIESEAANHDSVSKDTLSSSKSTPRFSSWIGFKKNDSTSAPIGITSNKYNLKQHSMPMRDDKNNNDGIKETSGRSKKSQEFGKRVSSFGDKHETHNTTKSPSKENKLQQNSIKDTYLNEKEACGYGHDSVTSNKNTYPLEKEGTQLKIELEFNQSATESNALEPDDQSTTFYKEYSSTEPNSSNSEKFGKLYKSHSNDEDLSKMSETGVYFVEMNSDDDKESNKFACPVPYNDGIISYSSYPKEQNQLSAPHAESVPSEDYYDPQRSAIKLGQSQKNDLANTNQLKRIQKTEESKLPLNESNSNVLPPFSESINKTEIDSDLETDELSEWNVTESSIRPKYFPSESSSLKYTPRDTNYQDTPSFLDSTRSRSHPVKEMPPVVNIRDMVLQDEKIAYEQFFNNPTKNYKYLKQSPENKFSTTPINFPTYEDDSLFKPTELSDAFEYTSAASKMSPNSATPNWTNEKDNSHPSFQFVQSDLTDSLQQNENTDSSTFVVDSGKKQKHASQGSNEDARSEISNQSYMYDHQSDSSSIHTTPDHRTNGSKRRLDAEASLPSITISEAEGLASTRGESDGENHDFLMKGSQSIRSGQSMSSSVGLTSSMGSHDSLSSYYSNAGEFNYGKINVTGDIQFGLDYDYKTSCLEIRVKQCRNLAPADVKKNKSDPYVKSYLLPDKTKTGKRKTKVKKNNLNPTFDESLRYFIAKSELENRTLWLTIWHNDRFGRNDFLGEVTIPFDYYRFEGPTLKWHQLQQRQEYLPSSLSYKGELTLSLKFVTGDKLLTGSTTSLKQSREGRSEVSDGGQLHVYIKEAKNLTAVRSGGYSDPFCKGYLLPEKNRTSKQKTPVAKKNCNPVWNHSFVFEDVSASLLTDRCIELTLWDYDRLSSNDFLGGVRLNLGSGICGRRYVDWMDAVGDEISLWQSMISRPNTWVDGTLILRANMNNRM